MQNFEFHVPTRIIFGKDILDGLGTTANEYGSRALLVYGRNSIKENGLYDRVKNSLEQAGMRVTDFSGVQPNPIISHARQGAALAKSDEIEVIVAVGGGSVIDEAKAIAAGACYDGDLWDFFDRKEVVKDALPVIAVQTIPATSSEDNCASVITNPDTNEKFGLRSPHLFPRVALLDPSLTLTLPVQYTAYACFDIMSHLMEGYFTSTDPFAPVQDGFVEGTIRAVMRGFERIQKNPADWDARAAVMWAGALGWNDLCKAGVIGATIPNHMLAHPLGGIYDIAHGAALALIFPAWLKYRREQLTGRILLFGQRVLEIGPELDALGETEACDLVIRRFSEWIAAAGCPLSLREAGISEPDYEELARQAFKLCDYWNIDGYSEQDLEAIYRSAY